MLNLEEHLSLLNLNFQIYFDYKDELTYKDTPSKEVAWCVIMNISIERDYAHPLDNDGVRGTFRMTILTEYPGYFSSTTEIINNIRNGKIINASRENKKRIDTWKNMENNTKEISLGEISQCSLDPIYTIDKLIERNRERERREENKKRLDLWKTLK